MSPRTTARSAPLLLTVALTAVLALTGCSGDKGAAAAACPAAASAGPAPEGASTDLGKKPEVKVPSGPAPTTLQVMDIKTGDGGVACTGDALTVKYVGVTYKTGKQFDASWDRGQDFPFTIGQMAVIEGWEKGLLGMRKGGRRELVIPPALGYGDQAQGADIPANSTLVFVVDLVDLTKAPSGQ